MTDNSKDAPRNAPPPNDPESEEASRLLSRPFLPDRLESESRLGQEVDRALRYHHPLCIVLMDIDPLSTGVAKRTGVDVDRVLGTFIRRAKSVLRESDQMSYWTELVFLWILPETELDAAILACERLRSASSSLVLGELPPLTLSVGVAQLEPGEDSKSLARRAGDALLISQARGRNCITRADVLPRPEKNA